MPFVIKVTQFATALSIFSAIIVCLVNLVVSGRAGRVWLLLTVALGAEFLVVFRDIVDAWVGFGPFGDVFAKFDYFSVVFTFMFAVAAHQFISYKRDELINAFGASRTFKRILESSLGALGDGFDVVASDLRVIYSNRVMTDLLGPDGGLRHNSGVEPSVATQLVMATLKSGVLSRGEQVIVREGGPRRVMDIVVSPIISGDGVVLACVRVARDITEMKEMQEAIREANVRLEEKVAQRTAELEKALARLRETHEQLLQSEKLAALGKIAAGLTHNIANPLSVLGPKLKLFGDYFWYVDRVLREYRTLHNASDARQIKQRLKEIEKKSQEGRGIDYYLRKLNRFVMPCVKEVHTIERIVQDLVDYSRMQKPEVEAVDLNEQLRLVTSLLEYEFRSKQITVQSSLDDRLPPVECYAAEINQVLTNLLMNSVEALSVKRKQDPSFVPRIKISTEAGDSSVRIRIEDNGVGVSKEDARRVFDPFFTTKPIGSGVGLGLSVSAGIIEKHNGTIDLDSEPGKYSRFTITLPVALQREEG